MTNISSPRDSFFAIVRGMFFEKNYPDKIRFGLKMFYTSPFSSAILGTLLISLPAYLLWYGIKNWNIPKYRRFWILLITTNCVSIGGVLLALFIRDGLFIQLGLAVYLGGLLSVVVIPMGMAIFRASVEKFQLIQSGKYQLNLTKKIRNNRISILAFLLVSPFFFLVVILMAYRDGILWMMPGVFAISFFIVGYLLFIFHDK